MELGLEHRPCGPELAILCTTQLPQWAMPRSCVTLLTAPCGFHLRDLAVSLCEALGGLKGGGLGLARSRVSFAQQVFLSPNTRWGLSQGQE